MDGDIKSIGDLRIVLDAKTEQFSGNIQSARDLIAKFSSEGNVSLSKLDGWLVKLGDTASLLPGKLSAIGAQIAMLQAAWSQARDIAEKIGLKDDIEDVEGAFSQFWTTFQMAGASALERAGADVSNYKQKLVELQAQQEENAKTAAKSMTPIGQAISDIVRDADANVARYFSGLEGITDTQLTRIRDRTREQLKRAEESGIASADSINGFWKMLGNTIDSVRQSLEEFRTAAKEVEDEYNKRLIDRMPKTLPEELFTDLEKRTDALRKQNFELEIQRETFGKSAAEAAKLAEQMRLLDEAEGRPFLDPKQKDEYDSAVERNYKLRQSIEALVEAKRSAERQAREQDRQEKGITDIDNRFEADLAQIQAKTLALTQSSRAAEEMAYFEKQMADARRKNIELTDADVEGIRAQARAMADASEVFRTRQKELQRLQEDANVFNQSILSEFSRWTQGAELDFKRMVSNMLAEAARLALMRNVLGPLFGGSGTDAKDSWFGSMFGGFRATGGPVEAGRSYMVGENGPEVITMGASGNVSAAAASQTFAPVINVDARGATIDAVAALEQRLPGIVLNTMQQARERGMA